MVRAFLKKGRESLTDDPRPGRPVSARSTENAEKIRAIVMQERGITSRNCDAGEGNNH
jgi:hypothetical protein